MIAGRLVLDPARLVDPTRASARPHVELDRGGPLASPDVAALARSGRSTRPTPPRIAKPQPGRRPLSNRCGHDPLAAGTEIPGVAAAALRPDLATFGGQELLGVLDDLAGRPVEDRPERLPERADPYVRGAEHHLLAEGADVAPALAPGAAKPERHRPGREWQVGGRPSGSRQGRPRSQRAVLARRPRRLRRAASLLDLAIGSPALIEAPTSTASDVTLPALWAVISFSIFIASMTTTESPSSTSSPSATSTLKMLPCSGATTSSPEPPPRRRPCARASAGAWPPAAAAPFARAPRRSP